MPARRKQSYGEEDNTHSLDEVLQDSDVSNLVSFAGANSVVIVRFIYTVSALGGMASFWYDGRNKRICISMRLWGGQRSWQLDSVEQLEQTLEPIVGKLIKHLREKNLPPPPLLDGPEKPPKPK